MTIDGAFNELIKKIEGSDIYQRYIHILDQVENNDDINSTISDIKKYQKRIVKVEYHKESIKELEDVLEEKKKELYNIPLYQDYIEASNELNDVIKIVKDKIQLYVDGLEI